MVESGMAFSDHFSGVASQYATNRPQYPDALFAWIAEHAPARDVLWDAGCGSGQASVGLAAHFARVIATDASAAQAAAAERRANIAYGVAAELNPALTDASVDVVTVAQAVHWFRRELFWAEAQRVLKPGGLLAVWTYGLTRISRDVDDVVEAFYRDTLREFWPAERMLVETEYRDIGFPWPTVHVPAFAMESSWTCERFIGYLGTWSAVKEYRQRTAADPIPEVQRAIEAVWPATDVRDVRWPLTVCAGHRPR
jgi:ubiquinone/menaquinone biosynthesis C-methylase UbiE